MVVWLCGLKGCGWVSRGYGCVGWERRLVRGMVVRGKGSGRVSISYGCACWEGG